MFSRHLTHRLTPGLVVGALLLLISPGMIAETNAPAVTVPSPQGEGLRIASGYTLQFNATEKLPSRVSTDAALLGNGDMLVAFGSSKDKSLQFSIGKNDLWLMREKVGSQPMPLAMLSLDFPALRGAALQLDQNIGTATSTGTLEALGATLAFETGVFATQNILWIKLKSVKGDLKGTADLSRAKTSTITLKPSNDHLQIGRDARKGGQWYFTGLIESVSLFDRALSEPEVASLVKGQNPPGLVRDYDYTSTLDPASAKGNVTLVDGREGHKAAQFDGATGYIDADPWRPTNDAFTVSALVHLPKTKDKVATLVSGSGFSLMVVDGRFRVSVGDRTADLFDPLPVGEWVRMTVVYDGSSFTVYQGDKRIRRETKEGWLFASDKSQPVWTALRDTSEEEVMRPAAALCALRNLDGDLATLDIPEGKTITLIATTDSLEKNKDFRTTAVQLAKSVNEEKLTALRMEHLKWWADFWNRSWIQIPDKVLERQYYASNYALASSSRDLDFPPGIFGWCTADYPLWFGDYHLNYNHIAPYYSLFAANHIEQGDPCITPLLDNLEEAKAGAMRDLKIEGAIQKVGIGPKGSMAGATYYGQKSNAAMSCVPMALRWYATYDLDFAKKSYPFVRETARFWQNYLKYDGTHYNITNDAIHENSGSDMNSVHSLALVKQALLLATDMSKELGVDADLRPKWEEMASKLAPFPTCTVRDLPEQFWPAHLPKDEQTLSLPIFRYTEKGTAWWKNNTLGIQHIYPGGGIGLGSQPELQERARNQIKVMNRWVDYNGMNSFYVAAARVGYDPNIILAEMRKMFDAMGQPNGMIKGNSHGMEHFSIAPNALQEMLFQSHEGVLRFFPDWPKDQDASFGGLRARGAFVVSSAYRKGSVTSIHLTSEKGRPCSIQNPWPDRSVLLVRKASGSESTLSGETLSFPTSPGEVLELSPKP